MTGCITCHKEEPEVKLMTCQGCHSAQYCSKECQKSDWPKHKGPCRSKNPVPPSPGPPPSVAADWFKGLFGDGLFGEGLGDEDDGPFGRSPPKGLDSGLLEPFTCLQNGTFLHNRSERDVYRILIDSFRFRLEELCQHIRKAKKGTVYDNNDDSLPDFKHYLEAATSRNNLLPPWWTPEKQRECEAFGMSGTEFQNLHEGLDQGSIIWQYADSRFPSQLRMLAEAVYERGIGETSSFTRRGELAEMEAQRRSGRTTN